MLKPGQAHLLISIVLAGALVVGGDAALGCGWWGDGEAPPDDTIIVLPGGAEVAERDLSDPATMARLSRDYRLGNGVSRDLGRARSWAERAAHAGHAGAMNDLGQMLEVGIGGPADPATAARWYQEAAQRGVAKAQHSLAMILETGRGLPVDMAASNRWLRESAAQGHVTAAVDLANRLWTGRAEPQKPAEGCLWWLVALERGHPGTAEACLEHDPRLSEAALAGLRDEARRRSADMHDLERHTGGDS